MKRLRDITRATLALLLSASLWWAAPLDSAHAWDSICHEYSDATADVAALSGATGRGCEGPLAARGRWRDPTDFLDEHRIIFRHATQLAGLPPETLETFVLTVPTLGNMVDAGGGRSLPEYWPLALDHTNAFTQVEERGFAIDELAQLPDFSYSLNDWAGGNERCPVPELADDPAFNLPLECHSFKTHMGALNSSHFAPQSDGWYRWLHAQALTRADECSAMRNTIWTRMSAIFGEGSATVSDFDARWADLWQQCEAEALALEAVAQHYLQDSWSSGHMWQRWGSATLADLPTWTSTGTDPTSAAWNAQAGDFRRMVGAEMVALLSGTIHGVDAAVYEVSTHIITADMVCYPDDELIGYASGAGTTAAAGDMHLHDVLGDPLSASLFGHDAEWLHDFYDTFFVDDAHTSSAALMTQRDQLMDCAAASVREVYDRFADATSYGDPSLGAATGAAPTMPASCDAPRLTSHALSNGIESPASASLSYAIGVGPATLPGGAVPNDVEAQLFHGYDEIRRVAQLLGKLQPTGTEAANLAWSSFEYEEQVCTVFLGGECTWTTVTRTEPPAELSLLGMRPNGAYATAPGVPPAAYADPVLPWADPGAPDTLVDDTPQQVLASTFHRGHADLWCARMDGDELIALVNRAQDNPGDVPLRDHCIEMVNRHVHLFGANVGLCRMFDPTFAGIWKRSCPTSCPGVGSVVLGTTLSVATEICTVPRDGRIFIDGAVAQENCCGSSF